MHIHARTHGVHVERFVDWPAEIKLKVHMCANEIGRMFAFVCLSLCVCVCVCVCVIQDVFSAGCVIAELFLDGRALFDLGTLLAYKQTNELPATTQVCVCVFVYARICAVLFVCMLIT